MNNWSNAVITEQGLALQAKLLAGNSLTITRAVSGTGYVEPAMLLKQTAVSGIKQELAIHKPSYPATGLCKMIMEIKNDGLSTGYTANQVGVYAKDPDRGEILYFICQVAQSGNGIIVPSASEMPGYRAEFSFYFQYGQADNVALEVDPSNTVTVEEAQDMIYVSVMQARVDMTTAREAEGVTIELDDSGDSSFEGLSLYGKTTQKTTTGKNLLDFEACLKQWGATYTKDGEKYTIDTVGQGFGSPIKLFEEDTVVSVQGILTNVASVNMRVDFGNIGEDGTFTRATRIGSDISKVENVSINAIRLNYTTPATFTIENIQMEIGTTATPYEPYTGGAPAPSPEYPQELESAGDGGSVDVTVLGKNLLPFPYKFTSGTKNGVTYTTNNDGSVTYNGTATAQLNPYFATQLLLTKGTYTISGSPAGSNWEKHLLIVQTSDYSKVIADDWGKGKTFTLNEDTKVNVCFIVANGATVSNLTIYPMLVQGTAVAEYEPYKAPKTLTAQTPNGLPGIPVTDASLATYTDGSGQMWVADERDYSRGILTTRIKKRRILSSDAWATNDNGRYWLIEDDFDNITGAALCTHFQSIANWENHTLIDGTFIIYRDPSWNDGRLSFKDSRFTSLEDWKQFLDANEVYVIYELDTPIETPIPAEEMAAYFSLQTHEHHTTITNDEGAYTKVKYFTPTNALPSSGGTIGGELNLTGHRIKYLAKAIEDGDALALKQALELFAPSGYGYGDALPIVTGSTDAEFLANIEALCAEKVKFSTFQAVVYPPGAAFDGNSFIAQVFHNSDSSGKKFIKIKAHGVTTIGVFQRVCYQSTWNEPEWENPPMIPGVEYRTTERYNGQAVYAKLTNLGAFTGTSTISVGNGYKSYIRAHAIAQYGSKTYFEKVPDTMIKDYQNAGIHYIQVMAGESSVKNGFVQMWYI